MQYRRFAILPLLLLLACSALAQNAATVAGVHSHKLTLQPVAASVVHYRASRDLPRTGVRGAFKFKHDRAETAVAPQGIPGQPAWMRPAAVMGAGRMDANGRPPVDCQRTPMDRQCR